MNSTQAKKIPLRDILARLGHQPVKSYKGGEELAYTSPFRQEKEASLFVNTHKNVWNDFGDIGGNALDFVMRYRNTSVSGALDFLNQLFSSSFRRLQPSFLPLEQGTLPKTENLVIRQVNRFGTNAKSLVSYIVSERRINPAVAELYLKEIFFTNQETNKEYFAAGFENLSGGYEIRNPFFKSSLGSKDMSVIAGSGVGEEVFVFEGFLDFLSKLTLENPSGGALIADCLILNSVSYAEKSIKLIRAKGYKQIKGYLDNDRAGDEVTLRLQAEFDGMFSDHRSEYQGFKDLNDFLKSIGK